MNIATAKVEIAEMRRKNKPLSIALGVCFALAAIYIDFYMEPSKRGIAQEITWTFFSVGFLFIFVRRTLRRRQLVGPFILTVMVQALFAYALSSMFPFENSLILIVFGVAGIFVLGVVFACFARLIDPSGPRPV